MVRGAVADVDTDPRRRVLVRSRQEESVMLKPGDNIDIPLWRGKKLTSLSVRLVEIDRGLLVCETPDKGVVKCGIAAYDKHLKRSSKSGKSRRAHRVSRTRGTVSKGKRS